jgi:hypothetical protein
MGAVPCPWRGRGGSRQRAFRPHCGLRPQTSKASGAARAITRYAVARPATYRKSSEEPDNMVDEARAAHRGKASTRLDHPEPCHERPRRPHGRCHSRPTRARRRRGHCARHAEAGHLSRVAAVRIKRGECPERRLRPDSARAARPGLWARTVGNGLSAPIVAAARCFV